MYCLIVLPYYKCLCVCVCVYCPIVSPYYKTKLKGLYDTAMVDAESEEKLVVAVDIFS